jgi:hypothetical protein
VPHHVEELGAGLRDDRDGRAIGNGARKVAELAVDHDRDRGLGEAGTDRAGDVVAGRAVGKLEPGAVGKKDVHGAGRVAAAHARIGA